jgi:hypothetical protein
MPSTKRLCSGDTNTVVLMSSSAAVSPLLLLLLLVLSLCSAARSAYLRCCCRMCSAVGASVTVTASSGTLACLNSLIIAATQARTLAAAPLTRAVTSAAAELCLSTL